MTLVAALVLTFFAGDAIKPFALVMSFGVVVATFSSVFIAAPTLSWIDRRPGAGVRPKVDRPSRTSVTSQ